MRLISRSRSSSYGRSDDGAHEELPSPSTVRRRQSRPTAPPARTVSARDVHVQDDASIPTKNRPTGMPSHASPQTTRGCRGPAGRRVATAVQPAVLTRRRPELTSLYGAPHRTTQRRCDSEAVPSDRPFRLQPHTAFLTASQCTNNLTASTPPAWTLSPPCSGTTELRRRTCSARTDVLSLKSQPRTCAVCTSGCKSSEAGFR